MAGILSYGVYVPIWRISRSVIAQAAGKSGAGGERSVAARDEDSITMAVEAGVDCMRGFAPEEVDALYFATASHPYQQKQGAAIIAAALDLPDGAVTADFCGTTRAMAGAMQAAWDAVRAGTCRRVLVVGAEHRVAQPASPEEEKFGDAAVAFLLGDGQEIARIEAFATKNDPVPGLWKRSRDAFYHCFDARFDRLTCVRREIPAVIKALLHKAGARPEEISSFAIAVPDEKALRELGKSCGFDGRTQAAEPFLATVGLSGNVQGMLSLVSALERSERGQRIVCVSQGDGAHAILLRTTASLAGAAAAHVGTRMVGSRKTIANYGTFSQWQGTRDTGWPPESTASVSMYDRDRASALSFRGMRCKFCGTLQYPIGRTCNHCRMENPAGEDAFPEVPIAMTGIVFTYTHDGLYAHGCIPGDGKFYTRAVVDMDDGCRVYAEVVDCEPEEIAIGTRVERTFRIIHQKGGYLFYGWRMRPVRVAIGGKTS